MMRAQLFAVFALSTAAVIGNAAAEPLRLSYEAYAGGLHVMSIDVSVEERGSQYSVASELRTRGVADFFMGMKLMSHAAGRLDGGHLLPLRYQNQSKFGRRERAIDMEPQANGLFYVQITPPPGKDSSRTPIPPGSLRGAVDPLTAMLRASRTVEATGSCTQAVPVFDGRRRYDLVFADEGDRQLTASRYSIFSGPARQCRIRQHRIGGFAKDSEDELGHESVIWIARPLAGAPPVPVRLELETNWGWLMIQLDEVAGPAGSIRLARGR